MVATRAKPRAGLRPAKVRDLPALRDVEDRAQALFRPYGLEAAFRAQLLDPGVLRSAQRAGRLFVATDDRDAPVGFALVTRLGPWAQLAEVDVLPEWGRRGIGSALVERAIAWARDRSFPRIVLSTMRDVPWNAPFYRRFGFEEVPAADFTPDLRRLRAEEARRGLPVSDRTIMRLDLTRGTSR